jgi:hypothetical protein
MAETLFLWVTMEHTGNIKKLVTLLVDPVNYYLPVGQDSIFLNEMIGKSLELQYTGTINCIHCGRLTKKSFQQGYCFPCFNRLNECGNCMIFPEHCLHGTDGCDPKDWVHEHCMTPHIVYLANSSELKVGITRETQIPTRWIDQGAIQALPIFHTTNRFLAGQIEVILKNYVKDKTNWREMLQGRQTNINLLDQRDALLKKAKTPLKKFLNKHKDEITEVNATHSFDIIYPVTIFPKKIKTYNLDKTPQLKDCLLGIKGQYLIFENAVINVRKYSGYELKVKVVG